MVEICATIKAQKESRPQERQVLAACVVQPKLLPSKVIDGEGGGI